MRCKQCDYRLWNLETRRCPECGTEFRPSEFEFVPNTVHFCCPHCDQHYFGTGPKGHLVPAEFDCIRCDAHIRMDDMVLRPAAGLDDEQTGIPQLPWLDRARRGPVRSWLSAVGMALVRPTKLIDSVPIRSSVASAVWFATLTNILTWFVSLLPLAVITIGGISLFARGAPGTPVAGLAMLAGFACGGIGIVVAAVVWVLIWGLTTHALLVLTGSTAGGLRRTCQAIGYSAGANVVSAVPLCGYYVGWIWWAVSAVLMVKQGQRVHGGRAAVATLAPPLLGVGSAIALYALLLWKAMAIQGAMTAGAGPPSLVFTPSMAKTRAVCDAMLAYATHHGGKGPDHAIQLVHNGDLVTTDLFIDAARPGKLGPPFAGTTLDEFDYLSDERKEAVVQACVDALPDNVVAHRLGDFVFVHHGAELAQPEPRLWLVLMWVDPGSDQRPPAPRRVVVGRADGTVEWVDAASFETRFEGQNQLRAGLGLPPIPHPHDVRHGQPFVGPDAPVAHP